MPARILDAAALARLEHQFRTRYNHALPGRIVSVGLGSDGSHPFLRVLVSTQFPTRALPSSFAGLPVLVRKTSVGYLA